MYLVQNGKNNLIGHVLRDDGILRNVRIEEKMETRIRCFDEISDYRQG